MKHHPRHISCLEALDNDRPMEISGSQRKKDAENERSTPKSYSNSTSNLCMHQGTDGVGDNAIQLRNDSPAAIAPSALVSSSSVTRSNSSSPSLFRHSPPQVDPVNFFVNIPISFSLDDVQPPSSPSPPPPTTATIRAHQRRNASSPLQQHVSFTRQR